MTTASPAVGRLLLALAKALGRDLRRLESRHGLTFRVAAGGQGVPRRRCCRRAWLRGTLLLSGVLTAPQKGYNLEWSGAPALLQQIAAALAREGVRARLYERTPGHWVLYSKNAGEIATVLAATGATAALFRFEDVRTERDVRNQVHRQVNYEMANSQKTISASLRQVEEILAMRELGLLDALPGSLRQAARLREEHPYATLAELCAMSDPPVSKSGMNHRLRKLHAIMCEHAAGEKADEETMPPHGPG